MDTNDIIVHDVDNKFTAIGTLEDTLKESTLHNSHNPKHINRKELIVRPEDIKRRIKNTFGWIASLEAAKIEVETDGDIVILRGRVRTPKERCDAAFSVASHPGVSRVINCLEVDEPSSIISGNPTPKNEILL